MIHIQDERKNIFSIDRYINGHFWTMMCIITYVFLISDCYDIDLVVQRVKI